MNILYVAHEQSFNGATLCLLDLITQMVEKRHQVYVLMHGWSGSLAKELEAREVKAIPAFNYPWVYSGQKGFNLVKPFSKRILNFASLLYELTVLRKYNLDLIHTNTSYINKGAFLRRYLNIPHVWHFREFLEEGLGLCFFDRNKSLKFIDKYSDAILFVSKALYKKYEPFFNSNKMHLVHDGIPKKYIQTKNIEDKNGSELKILLAGYLKEDKGQIDAVMAIVHLKEMGFDNIFLTIAGSGNPDYEAFLHKTVDRFGVNEKVKFVDWQASLNGLRLECDLELVCSKCEGFGRTTIEAMMSMNPVVGASSGATPELVKEGENGLLYRPGNSLELAEKILYFLCNRQELVRMGRNASVWAKDFTVEKNANCIEDIYLRCYKRHHNYNSKLRY